MARTAAVVRAATETDMASNGTGRAQVAIGIGLLDRMLTAAFRSAPIGNC